MLNIPDSVKALFKQDGVYKNFRARFPNGELPDITNENIVQESVKFTESICSQDIFCFGLAEASCIEFETVGIENIYGYFIECGIEIDCSSLSAAEKASIAEGTWDGDPIYNEEQVVSAFRVPYGVFRVESCPRDHQALAHRNVTAYTLTISDDVPPPQFEQTKISAHLPTSATYKPNAKRLIMSFFAENSEETMTANGYTKTLLKKIQADRRSNLTFFGTAQGVGKNSQGMTVLVEFDVYGTVYYLSETQAYTGTAKDSLFHITQNYNGSSLFSAIELRSFAINPAQSGYASLGDFIRANFKACYTPDLAIVNPSYTFSLISYAYYNKYIPIDKDFPCIYPYRGKGMTVAVRVPLLIVDKDSTAEYGSRASGSISVSEWLGTEDTLKLAFAATYSNGNYTGFADAYSMSEVIENYLEPHAQFCAPARKGGFELIRLSKTSPITVLPGEYEQFWYDDFDVEQIKEVRYSLMNSNGETLEGAVETGLSGNSIYEMSGNNAFAESTMQTTAAADDYLTAQLVPYLPDIAFSPIDLVMKGLPYLQARDYLSVAAQDGAICESYILRQEISGVQVLESKIESTSGMIVEVSG